MLFKFKSNGARGYKIKDSKVYDVTDLITHNIKVNTINPVVNAGGLKLGSYFGGNSSKLIIDNRS